MSAKHRVAILTFIGLLIISIFPITLSQASDGEPISLDAGEETFWSSLPAKTASGPQVENVPLLGYEIDPVVLQELKDSPFVSRDKIPSVVQDLAASPDVETEPLAPALHGNFEGQSALRWDH